MQPSAVAYAVIQSIHNIGAALALGLAMLLFLKSARGENVKSTLWFLLIVWGLQGATGILFGMTSLYFHGAFPKIPLIAQASMAIKVACVALAFSVSAWLLYKKAGDVSIKVRLMYMTLPMIALVAAAVLRWSS
jgi:hypothetical protein